MATPSNNQRLPSPFTVKSCVSLITLTNRKKKINSNKTVLIFYYIQETNGTTAPRPPTAFSPNLSTYHFLPHRACGNRFVIAFTTNTIAGNGNTGTLNLPASHTEGTSQGARWSAGPAVMAPAVLVLSTSGIMDGGVSAGKTAVPTSANPVHSIHSQT